MQGGLIKMTDANGKLIYSAFCDNSRNEWYESRPSVN